MEKRVFLLCLGTLVFIMCGTVHAVKQGPKWQKKPEHPQSDTPPSKDFPPLPSAANAAEKEKDFTETQPPLPSEEADANDGQSEEEEKENDGDGQGEEEEKEKSASSAAAAQPGKKKFDTSEPGALTRFYYATIGDTRTHVLETLTYGEEGYKRSTTFTSRATREIDGTQKALKAEGLSAQDKNLRDLITMIQALEAQGLDVNPANLEAAWDKIKGTKDQVRANQNTAAAAKLAAFAEELSADFDREHALHSELTGLQRALARLLKKRSAFSGNESDDEDESAGKTTKEWTSAEVFAKLSGLNTPNTAHSLEVAVTLKPQDSTAPEEEERDKH